MKEIPIPYVRTNQAFMVLLIALSALLQQSWIIVLVFVIELIGLLVGVKGNLFIQIFKPFLKDWAARSHTEADELQRFNNSIAVTLLAISVIALLLGFQIIAYIFAGMVALAALVAICGYCIGCTLYYQFKKFRRTHHS
jgi:hypothetical protein